jgi:hypothetical protein
MNLSGGRISDLSPRRSFSKLLLRSMHYVLPRHYLRRPFRDDQLYGERETDSAGNNLDLLNKSSLPSQDPWIFALGFGGSTGFRLSSRALAERRSGLGRAHR